GSTALHLASQEGHTETVRLLLTRGVRPDARKNDGATPLHIAASFGQKLVAILLLEANKDYIDLKDEDGWTPLHLASWYGQEQIVQLLLENCADFNA
ncbi:ankyrin repeat protein, partial [Aspergillus heteromorphus CBS 117.55]